MIKGMHSLQPFSPLPVHAVQPAIFQQSLDVLFAHKGPTNASISLAHATFGINRRGDKGG